MTVNSMALEGDNCHMCTKARKDLELISEKLKCAQVGLHHHNIVVTIFHAKLVTDM